MGTRPSKRITNDDTIEDTGQEGDRTEDIISKRSWAADRFLNETLYRVSAARHFIPLATSLEDDCQVQV